MSARRLARWLLARRSRTGDWPGHLRDYAAAAILLALILIAAAAVFGVATSLIPHRPLP